MLGLCRLAVYLERRSILLQAQVPLEMRPVLTVAEDLIMLR